MFRDRHLIRCLLRVSLLVIQVGWVKTPVCPIRNAFTACAAEVFNLRRWSCANPKINEVAHLLGELGMAALWALDRRAVIGIATLSWQANNSFKRMPLHSFSILVGAGQRHRLTQVLDAQFLALLAVEAFNP